jgi:heme/copper-type cytochrome/quinol oxidase subunit 2
LRGLLREQNSISSGLSGMPRRITDFPDYYEGWNQVSSFGSSISLVASLVFFYVIFDMFVYGKAGEKAPYSINVLTLFKLSETLENLFAKNLKASNKNFFVRIEFVQKGMLSFLFMDATNNWQFGFQDPGSELMEGIINLHHDIMFFLIWVMVVVSFLMFNFIIGKSSFSDTVNIFDQGSIKNLDTTSNSQEKLSIELPTEIQHNTFLEIVWTLIPCFILLLIAVPSFSLLYAIEDFNIIESTIKIIGNQWYWSYEIPGEVFEKKFDSVMILEEDLTEGTLRLLEVDNRLKLPVERQLRLFITSTDVLHSFAVPSLAVKLDACPGRLNQVALWIKRTGIYYGQCSEICGIKHAYMPIVIEAVFMEDYLEWLFPKKYFNI